MRYRGRHRAHGLSSQVISFPWKGSGLLGSVVHPLVDVPAEKAPMLSDFGSRELTQAGELIHCGLRHAQKLRDLHHSQNLALR